MSGSLRNWFKVRFITGFFVTVPAIATSWLLYVFWDAIDTFFSPIYERMFGHRIPGLGFLTAVGLIFIMGAVATNVAGRRVLAWLDYRLLYRIPVAGAVYLSVKQLIQAFSPERRSAFKELVLAEHPRKG